MASTRLNPEYQPVGDYPSMLNPEACVVSFDQKYYATAWDTVAHTKTIVRELLNSIAVSMKYSVQFGIIESYGRHFYIAYAYPKSASGNPLYGGLFMFSYSGQIRYYNLNNDTLTAYDLGKTQI